MLVDLDNPIASRNMLDYLSTHCKRDSIANLQLFSAQVSLGSHIQLSKSNYQLKRVQFHNRKGLPTHEKLMKADVKGKYVCVLLDSNYSTNHAVGIDCDSEPKMIWDCCESQALNLCVSHLNRCVGSDESFVRISYIGELVQYG